MVRELEFKYPDPGFYPLVGQDSEEQVFCPSNSKSTLVLCRLVYNYTNVFDPLLCVWHASTFVHRLKDPIINIFTVLILACGLAGILRNMSSDCINLKTVRPPARRKKKPGAFLNDRRNIENSHALYIATIQWSRKQAYKVQYNKHLQFLEECVGMSVSRRLRVPKNST